MTDNAQPVLVNYLARHYEKLKQRLTHLLGNDDLAGDALQDTWLRLHSQENEGPVIKSPGAYLVRVAVNIAVDRQRRQARSLSIDDISALLELSDPAPGPVRITESRAELSALQAMMEGLPPRRRQILILVRWEGLLQKDVAERMGLSLRTVEKELKRAHDYLDACLDNENNPS